MRILLLLLAAFLISVTLTKHKGHSRRPRTPCPPRLKRLGRCNPKIHIYKKNPATRKPTTRKPPTRKTPRPREKLDNNERKIDANVRKINAILADGRKIEAILENVSDLKNNTSKKKNDEYEYEFGEYGSGYEWYECYGLSSCDGPKTKSKLIGKKLDTILENMSDLKTTIYNALNGKMRDAKQNEDNPSTTPRTKPAKNLPHQEIEESAAYQSGSGDMD